MPKKPKQPHSSSSIKNNNRDSSSSNTFKTLFGDIPEQGNPSVSLFSDNNPFRRKPAGRSQTPQQQQGLGFGTIADTGTQEDGDLQNANPSLPKKRKRNSENVANIDSDLIVEAPETPLETKKSKNGEPGNPNLGMELNATVSSEKEQEGRRKKKRKRDQLEAKYEEKRYGVVVVKEESVKGEVAVGQKRKTLDNPEDMVATNEGFDDEDKLLRTVFVGNLPLKLKKKALLREFSQFGEVESIRIRSVPITNSKVPRKGAVIKKQINDSVDSVHAYIVFKMEESAQASLSHNMSVVGGNHIRVDRACPPRKKLKGENALLYDNKRTVFVGNLPFDVKDEEIYQLFSGINNLESSIEAVRVIRDPGTSVGKGIAYVCFKTRDAANLVVNNKKRKLKIRDRELRLYHAKSNATPSKRKNSFPGERDYAPAKKLAVDSRTPDSNNKVKTKAAISYQSYQGLRASKSGVQKKVHRKISEPMKLESRTQKVQKPKVRKDKRPAVAARKTNSLMGGGGSKQSGKKHKLESQTPESAHRSKKARKFR